MIFYADSLSNGIIISVFCRILISDAELTSFSGRKQEKVANNFFSSAIVFGTGKLVMSAVKFLSCQVMEMPTASLCRYQS